MGRRSMATKILPSFSPPDDAPRKCGSSLIYSGEPGMRLRGPSSFRNLWAQDC
jgi:hypothetical protein